MNHKAKYDMILKSCLNTLFTIAKTQKQTKCSLTEEWIKKMWYTYNRTLLSLRKQNNATSSNMDTARDDCTKWSKRKMNIWYHLYVESKILHRWTYQWNRNRLTDIENRLAAAERGRGEGGMDRECEVSRCELLYREWIDHKVLLYSTGNGIQYPVINHNGI